VGGGPSPAGPADAGRAAWLARIAGPLGGAARAGERASLATTMVARFAALALPALLFAVQLGSISGARGGRGCGRWRLLAVWAFCVLSRDPARACELGEPHARSPCGACHSLTMTSLHGGLQGNRKPRQ